MVARKDDQGVVEMAVGLQPGEQVADDAVERRDRRVVSMHAFSLPGFGKLHAGFVQEGALGQGRRVGWGRFEDEFLRIMGVPRGAGGLPSDVRGMETDAGQERLLRVALLLEELQQPLGTRCIGEGVGRLVGAVEADLRSLQAEIFIESLQLRRPGLGRHVLALYADVPGLGVDEAVLGVVVVELADRARLVAMLAEPAAHRHRGRILDEMVRVGVPVVQAEHERGPAGRADDALRVGALENNALLGQPIEVRRDGRRVTVAAKSRGQIVRDDEEDIRSVGCRFGRLGRGHAQAGDD